MAEISGSSLLGLIGGGLGSVAQLGLGIAERIKAKKTLDKAQSFYEQNKYEIPEAAKSALSSAERQASTLRLPGEDITRSQIATSTAQGVGAAQQAATSSSDVLSALASLYGGQQTAEQNLALAGAQRYDQNQSILQNELGRMAGYEEQRWNYNVYQPYVQMLGQAEAYGNRGAQGISAGITGLGQTAGMYSQLSSEEQMYQDYLNRQGFGNQQPTTLVGAQALNKVTRQNLPSYNMKIPDSRPKLKTWINPKEDINTIPFYE